MGYGGALLVAALLLTAALGSAQTTESAGWLMPDTPAATPYFLRQGPEPGPVIAVWGGMHGDEVAGYRAAEALRQWPITKGTLVLVPRAARIAIERGVRAAPGNMNALFPGDANGDLMYRLAAALWELLKMTKPQLLITLHESVGFHCEEPERYGQTLTYDWHELDPLMQRAIDRVNPAIAVPRDKFLLFVKPFPHCPTYEAWRWLQLPATSIETCRQLPLETRIQYQLMMLMGFFDELGLGYEPVAMAHLPTWVPPAPPEPPAPALTPQEPPPAEETPPPPAE